MKHILETFRPSHCQRRCSSSRPTRCAQNVRIFDEGHEGGRLLLTLADGRLQNQQLEA